MVEFIDVSRYVRELKLSFASHYHIGSLCEINKQGSDMQSDYYVDVFDRT